MAKIEEVRVDLKFSREVADSEWVSIGLGASATVSPNETFEMAIQEVEHQLRVEIRQAWGRLRKDKAPKDKEPSTEVDPAGKEPGPEDMGDEEIDEPSHGIPAGGPPPDPSWCPAHQVKMKRKEKDDRFWYSHKVGDIWCNGHWCKEHNVPLKRYTKGDSEWYSHWNAEDDLWCRGGEQK